MLCFFCLFFFDKVRLNSPAFLSFNKQERSDPRRNQFISPQHFQVTFTNFHGHLISTQFTSYEKDYFISNNLCVFVCLSSKWIFYITLIKFLNLFLIVKLSDKWFAICRVLSIENQRINKSFLFFYCWNKRSCAVLQ